MRHCNLLLLYSLIVAVLLLPAQLSAEPLDNSDGSLTAIGERIYREGILSDGQPLKATLSGDVSVEGQQFACIKCHQRSGLGTTEGSVISWRVTGRELYTPRRRSGAWSPQKRRSSGNTRTGRLPKSFNPGEARPAYTDESLSTAIYTGVDPAGRVLNSVMPRYTMDDDDMAALTAYLKTLSQEFSPGVDETSIRFATVVSDSVDPQDQAAMLDVLRTHVSSHNTQTRPHAKRITKGPFYRTEMNNAYRFLELDVWRLTGDESTWPSQMERYYRERPVFALLGGVVSGSWEPVHRFCEQNGVPAIFPVTDYPVINGNDWYTLYFSKGAFQEGETAARYLQFSNFIDEGTRVVQVFRDSGAGAYHAKGFRKAWKRSGNSNLVDHLYTDNRRLPDELPANERGSEPMVWLLWLEKREEFLSAADWIRRNASPADIIISSWDLLPADLNQADKRFAERFLLTFPYALPQESSHKKRRLEQWLKIRGIPSRNLSIEDRMYFLGWMLSAVLKNMRNEFYRDYFLENFEMMREQDRAIALYPHVSFATGQRFIAKGSYIVRQDQETGELKKVSDWSIY